VVTLRDGRIVSDEPVNDHGARRDAAEERRISNAAR
jgi:hypothetical protein